MWDCAGHTEKILKKVPAKKSDLTVQEFKSYDGFCGFWCYEFNVVIYI